MKKAKIMLSAIAVIAMASGVLAFKANKLALVFTGTSPAVCTQAVEATILVGGTPSIYASVAQNNESTSGITCPYTSTVFQP